MLIAVEIIRTDGGTQPRSEINAEASGDYAEAMSSGAIFPPLDVFYDGSSYWLADGFHRLAGYVGAGIAEVECDIHQGTQADAQWFSFSANKINGLRRTNEDKQRAVKSALLHVSGLNKSDRAIADHVGVDHATVLRWREKLCASGEMHQTEIRTVTRGGATYQQNTANIGRAPKIQATEAQPDVRPICGGQVGSSTLPGGSIPFPPAPIPEPLSRERVWAAQETKYFTKELLRLIRSYEKTHPLIEALVVSHINGVPVGVEVVSAKEDAA